MDKYRIDSHKLMYHVSRVHDWLEGKNIYPIYIEISPSGACNHRCVYCGLDFMNYQPRHLNTAILKDRLSELGRLGLKSVMYAGEGEPFLHKDMPEIITHTKKSGIDVAVATNAVLFNEEIAEKTLGNMEWIKVSISGSTEDTYAKIHRSRPGDFEKVIKNMSRAVKIKERERYLCVLGMQFLILPENYHEAVSLAKLARDMGMDYLVVKPYSQHPQSRTTTYKNIKYSDYEYLMDELMKLNTPKFSAIFRISTMKRWDKAARTYKGCLALPFWSYIDSGGNVWGCSVYLGDKKFFYGNICEYSFQEIWEGKRRLDSLHWVAKELDLSKCRINCRMDEINRYLWELKNPIAHVNFI